MRRMFKSIFLVMSLFAIAAMMLTSPAYGQGGSWMEPWGARHEVTVPNPCGEELMDYQIQIELGATFDFASALPDGEDLVVTDAGGMDCIPYWIEEWNPGAGYASIWAKVPLIPMGGTTLYLYYGNPTPGDPDPPELVEVGPIGPWDKQSTNIVPIGDPSGGAYLLGENMVYDDVTGHYWLVFAMYRGGSSVGLVWSDNPDDPYSWHWHGQVVPSANSPHILFHDGLWYIFYADRTVAAPYPISAVSSPNIGGPYTSATTVLTVTEPWEAFRVDEPYVFQRNDGKWIMMYMGDAGATTEQVGFAEADNLLGPYTKFAGNPCIPFGLPGAFDAGTVADAWVVELDGVYYIGYTASPTKHSPWNTALITTEDWVTFTKQGIILDLGGSGDWDEFDAFRGAVTRFGDTYYFPYTGSPGAVGNYVMGMATMSAYQFETIVSCNDPNEVFEFIDTFDGDDLDAGKWAVNYQVSGGSVDVAGGIATLTGISGGSSGYVQIRANTMIGTGTLMEAYAGHPDAGANPGPVEGNAAAEIGYKPFDFSWTTIMRIMDWPDLTYYSIQSSFSGNNSGYVPTTVPFNTDWHTYRVYRATDGTAQFQVDDNPFESLGAPYVSDAGLYPWLMSYARNIAVESRFSTDWLRVRKWCGADARTAVSPVELPVANISGHVTFFGSGVLGAAVALVDPGGEVIVHTDPDGYYLFEDVPNGQYTIELEVPLGFVPIGDPQVMITLAGEDLVVNFELEEQPMEKLLHEYWWKYYLGKLRDGVSNKYFTIDDIEDYCQIIFDRFYDRGDGYALQIERVTHIGDPPRPLNFDEVLYLIVEDPDRSYAQRARRAFLVDLLNIASGRLSQLKVVSVDGANVSQCLTYFHGLYHTHDWYNEYLSYVFLRWISYNMLIKAGIVDLSTPTVLFKPEDAGEPVLPNDFALNQNYPNPFNPNTEISFMLPMASDVRLDIFNITGQRIVTLVDGHLEAGSYSLEWDARNDAGQSVATGIYLYRLTADDFVASKKMILLK